MNDAKLESPHVALVRKIAAEVVAPAAAAVDRDARFPFEAVDALKQARMLSAYVPKEFGGFGVDIAELGAMCEALGRACASTGMVFAMHQIQVSCIVHHATQVPYYQRWLRDFVERQLVIASVTSETGVGGEMRRSLCAIERNGERFDLFKDASALSYGAEADALLVTARRAPDAAASDQEIVLVHKADYSLEKTGTWDTLGLRGTCSPPFKVRSQGHVDQILPAPFADIAAQTMVPFTHITWANCWIGIATAAMSKARAFVRAAARAKPGQTPPTALRLAEVASMLQSMRAQVRDAATEYQALLASPSSLETLSGISYALRTNNLKLSCSQIMVQIVHQCLLICGFAGFKNDTKFSMGQHYRDALAASIMVGNDRIFATNAAMLLVLKDD